MSPQKYGHMANGAAPDDRPACSVCDDPHPTYSWTDYHGEAFCTRCGTPYQLIVDGKRCGPPVCNIQPEAIPILRQFWAETQSTNGLGSFMVWDDYPDQREGRKWFNLWNERRLLSEGAS